MIGDRKEMAWYQSDFYRDSYHKVLRSLLISTFIMLGLIAAIIYSVLSQPSVPYYATTTSGQIIPMVPQQN